MASLTQLTALLALCAGVSNAAPADKAAPYAGSPVVDHYPPTGTTVNSTQFPPEGLVGFPGPTAAGAEAAAIQTAPSYPYNNEDTAQYPLVNPQPYGADSSLSKVDISKYWGNLSPWYSTHSSFYGLPDASPIAPPNCSVTQLHLFYRHGARYPTEGEAPSKFAQKLNNATNASYSSVSFSGKLSFLNTWTFKLGAEILTPFGRLQEFELGVAHRNLYGHLLKNFTESGTIPVFRTTSQDRMVKSAENFAAGFFGVPEYLTEVSIEILVETVGVNNSAAPYEVCPNSNVASKASLGTAAATKFAATAFLPTLARLQSETSGFDLTWQDVLAMLQLCSYETVALGYSAFCPLFTTEDFLNYEYYWDIIFYYENGPGSPVAAAQGKSYLDEFLGRITDTYPQANSALNETFDDNPTYFPLKQSIYADATHEVVVLDTLTAFNLTALFKGPPLNITGNRGDNSFVASKLVAFGTHFAAQVLSCPATPEGEQIRFIVNDAVVPLHESYEGCPENEYGLCPAKTVVEVLQKRSAEIDFTYDCFANYTADVGNDYNGRAPRN